jgi:hypothetical protein
MFLKEIMDMNRNFFLPAEVFYDTVCMQIVGENQELLTFCKNNRAFCLQFKQKLVPLHAQIVKK